MLQIVNASTWETLRLLELWENGGLFLKFTSGKQLSLSNVLYVPSLRKNLVYGILFNKATENYCKR